MTNLSDIDGFAAGGGNATVPIVAPIQPPQAWVDTYIAGLFSLGSTANITISPLTEEITSFDFLWVPLINCFNHCEAFSTQLYFEIPGAKLSAASVELILLNMSVLTAPAAGGFINLSGGTSANPTPQNAVLSDIADPGFPPELFVLGGVYNGRDAYAGITTTFRWHSGEALWEVVYNADSEVLETSTGGDVAYPWLATWTIGQVTQAPNAYVIACQANNWNVVTN